MLIYRDEMRGSFTCAFKVGIANESNQVSEGHSVDALAE
jgi:hypothetical protein